MNTPTLGKWLIYVMKESDAALSLEEALHVIMDSMKDYFPCQSVAVILIDDDSKEMRIKISRQISYTFAKKFYRNGPGPAAERVVLEQKPVLLNKLNHDTQTYNEIKLEHEFTSAILAPVISSQRGVGYLFCDRANGEEFGEVDMLHLQVLGYIIGSLIAKFELIRASRELSQYDESTKVLHYKAFVPAFATDLERAQTHDFPITLALVAVEAFRHHVEVYGIREAHEMLAAVAAVIKSHIRDMDILARFTADEFILSLSGVTEAEAAAKIDEIKRDIPAKVMSKDAQVVRVTVGMLPMREKKDLKRKLQDIIADLGHSLADAKVRTRLTKEDVP